MFLSVIISVNLIIKFKILYNEYRFNGMIIIYLVIFLESFIYDELEFVENNIRFFLVIFILVFNLGGVI